MPSSEQRLTAQRWAETVDTQSITKHTKQTELFENEPLKLLLDLVLKTTNSGGCGVLDQEDLVSPCKAPVFISKLQRLIPPHADH